MKYLLKNTLVIMLLATNNIFAQEILVDDFTNQIIHENFYEKTDVFPIQKSGENFFIIDDNEYLVSRNNSNSEYAIILESDIISNLFLKTSFRLGPSKNKEASIGIIIKADIEFNRAIILEINRKGEYRIKELSNDKYIFLTGKTRKNGWVRNKSINKENLHNEIEVRNKKNNLNFIINGNLISTLELKRFNKGYCGLLIGADTKARIKYYYLNSNGNEKILEKKTKANNKIEQELIDDKKTFKNSEEINDIKNENRYLKESLKSIEAIKLINSELEQGNIQLKKINKESKTKINDLENNINLKDSEFDKQLNIKTKKIQDVKKSNSEILEKNNSLNLEITNIKEEIKNLQDKLEKTSSSLSISQEKLKGTNNKLVDLNANYQKLLEKITSKNSQINSVNNDLKNTKKSLETLKNNNLNEKNLLIDNKNKLEIKLKKDIKKIITQKDVLVKTIDEFKKIIQTLKNDIITLGNTINNNNNAISASTKTIINLKEKNSKLLDSEKINNKIILDQNLKINTQENINNNLKEIFVYKDFELNGIKPSSLIAEKVGFLKAQEEIVEKDSIYSIQLGVFTTTVNIFNDIEDVFMLPYNNSYKYYCGEYFNLTEVNRRKNALIVLGIKNIQTVKILK
ncbi:MAG: hypothetical protein ACKVLD_05745 [Flavobacteriales bacterium]|tara:strand:+ start:1111 stop:3000 length:1890 start_codon:yes stop_codon:yes gene_type:complete